MSVPRCIQNLVLIGFMGTGKTSVGRLAAHQLGYDFVDTDELLERRAGKMIARIFAEEGEAAFRAMERELVIDLAGSHKKVIATGGGLAANAENLASLKQHALLVCLWATPEAIWQRVRHQTHRPLLQTADPLARIRALLEERTAFYREADVLVHTGLRSVQEVAQQVVHHFLSARTKSPRVIPPE